MSQLRLDDSTPAAPAGNTNVAWQLDAPTGKVSGYVPNATTPLTTKGDLYGFDTVPDRIPVGTDGDVLTADSGAALGVSWQAPAAGGGVIGTAIFDASGGSIGSLVTSGVISGVTYTSAGTYAVTLSPTQTNYVVLAIAEENSGTYVPICCISPGSRSSGGFTLLTVSLQSPAARDFPYVAIAVVKL